MSAYVELSFQCEIGIGLGTGHFINSIATYQRSLGSGGGNVGLDQAHVLLMYLRHWYGMTVFHCGE